MAYTIKEISEMAGISSRTLRYYDEIGLLSPSSRTEAEYRIYEEKEVEKLQQILFFKEMGFELKKIKDIIENPQFDSRDALENHRKILELKEKRIQALISLVEKTLRGERVMSLKEFNLSEMEAFQEKYAKEVEEKWGHSNEYKESAKRTEKYSKDDWNDINTQYQKTFMKFGRLMDLSPEDEKVQVLVKEWQNFISKNFYNCTDEILAGLGQMYIYDERFKTNIDKEREGLAEYINKAIEIYVK